MKMFTVLLVLSYAVPSFAFDIKPGLWQVQSTITINGKKFDPQAEMKKAMANLPPEHRKKMEDMLNKSAKDAKVAGHMTADGFQVCYTKDMLNNPRKFMEQSKTCKMNLKTQTATKLTGTFDCPQEKTTGTFEWTVKDSGQYNGVMTGKTKDGKSSMVEQNAKFISADCGSVKPDIE